MPDPTQLTIDGRQAPVQAAQAPDARPCVPDPLFHAPQTIRGQLAMPTDRLTPSEQHAAARCTPLGRATHAWTMTPGVVLDHWTCAGCHLRPALTPGEQPPADDCSRTRARSEDLTAATLAAQPTGAPAMTATTDTDHFRACLVTLLVPDPSHDLGPEDLAYWRDVDMPVIRRFAAKHGYAGVEEVRADLTAQHVNATHGGIWYSPDLPIHESWSYFAVWTDELQEEIFG